MKRIGILLTVAAILLIYDSAMTKDSLRSPAGNEVSHQYASSEDVYYFCDDGTVKMKYIISEYRNHRKYGVWKMRDHTISILWKWELGEQGLGKPIFCGSVCVYDRYKPFKRRITQTEKLDWFEIVYSEYREWQVKRYPGSCE